MVGRLSFMNCLPNLFACLAVRPMAHLDAVRNVLPCLFHSLSLRTLVKTVSRLVCRCARCAHLWYHKTRAQQNSYFPRRAFLARYRALAASTAASVLRRSPAAACCACCSSCCCSAASAAAMACSPASHHQTSQLLAAKHVLGQAKTCLLRGICRYTATGCCS